MTSPLSILSDVSALTEQIAAAAAQTEHDRAVPRHLVSGLAEAGVFRIAAPASAGGAEASPAAMYEVFEQLGRADGSTGWCAMIAAATSAVLGRLDPAVAKGLLADPGFLIAGVAAPSGRAVRTDGGYRVSGRWTFASASRHATWLVGGCVVVDAGGVVVGPQGLPEMVLAVLPAGQVTVHDTWHAVGLCGTGSHDFTAEDVLVPADHTFSLADPPVHDSPLYAFPFRSLLAFGIAAVALGIADAALAEFSRLAAAKANPMTGQVLAAKPAAQAAFAQATGLRHAGRAYLLDEIGRCWDLAAAGQQATVEDQARLRLAITQATAMAAQAVDLLYRTAGGSSVFLSSPLQRHFRDVHTATQHALVGADSLELAGALLLQQQVSTLRL
ncbi:hydroxylase [Catellatospora sp. TT07R-123]|uniref:acyl-CoA dehydrogenase family protein n=1 Tax=Catellatospora sp. TT07R-123 TaxID=2733863 RepID=UPI001B0DA667|nr:acyl-CoA dehydrogenase family protein [Catellatospora sp. TT07R-123]GHJ48241.1 hydroxylase [Catellatospora sp. TT07R-123]